MCYDDIVVPSHIASQISKQQMQYYPQNRYPGKYVYIQVHAYSTSILFLFPEVMPALIILKTSPIPTLYLYFFNMIFHF